MNDWLVPILAAILGGGAISAWAAYVVARGQIRKLSAEADKIARSSEPEAESIAVTTMKTALESVSAQVKTMQAEQKRCAERISSLEADRARDRELLRQRDEQVRAWEIFGADLHVRWGEHRREDIPPRLPQFSDGPDMPGDGPWQE